MIGWRGGTFERMVNEELPKTRRRADDCGDLISFTDMLVERAESARFDLDSVPGSVHRLGKRKAG